ncbi:LuxR C-terminal-related transcriptional regulator [Serratia fonticola]|uniref:LuxR C-terminal-related transcriptional regulator n=1 Tax=Serratia fonticola TaxID=47917 RepID=UPI00217CB0EE|nr:LuxR C-terminal-related transcriptional regulator [Serratia fonticola]CAI1614010.1 transcriptional regulator FimZ [Serratia fonticola]
MLKIVDGGYSPRGGTRSKRPLTWPDTNKYFHEGIVGYCDSVNTSPEQLKVVFIDFQLANLRLFLDQDWLMYSACNRVVLVTDSYLLPLANYYKSMFRQVDSVIQRTGASSDIFAKIDHVIAGEQVSSTSQVRLSSREICLLRTLIHGVTVGDLASRLRLSPKTVYALRHNILGKMGLTKMSDIFTRAYLSVR